MTAIIPVHVRVTGLNQFAQAQRELARMTHALRTQSGIMTRGDNARILRGEAAAYRNLGNAMSQAFQGPRTGEANLRTIMQHRRAFVTMMGQYRQQINTTQNAQYQMGMRGRESFNQMAMGMVRPINLMRHMSNQNMQFVPQDAISRLNQARMVIGQMKTPLMNMATHVTTLGKNAQWTGRQLMMGLTLPIAMAVKRTTQMYMQISKEMTRINKVSQVSKKQFEQLEPILTRGMKNVVKTYGVAQSEIARLTGDVVSMGYSIKGTNSEAARLSEEIIRTAFLGDIGISTARDFFRTMLKVFGQSADGTRTFNEQLKSTRFIIDQLNQIENKTVINVNQLADAMPKAAGAAKLFGLNAAELASVLTGVYDKGIQLDTAATGINFILTRILNPTKQAAEYFDNAFGTGALAGIQQMGDGMSKLLKLAEMYQSLSSKGGPEKANIAEAGRVFSELVQRRQIKVFVPLAQSLTMGMNQIRQAVLTTTEANAELASKGIDPATASLQDLQGVMRTYRAQLLDNQFLTEGWARATVAAATFVDVTTDNIQKLADQFGELSQREINIKLAAPETQFNILRETFRMLGAELGKALLPSLLKIMSAMAGFFERLSELPQGVKLAIANIAFFLAALGPLVYVMGTAATATGLLSKAFFSLLPSVKVVSASMLQLELQATGTLRNIAVIGQGTNAVFLRMSGASNGLTAALLRLAGARNIDSAAATKQAAASAVATGRFSALRNLMSARSAATGGGLMGRMRAFSQTYASRGRGGLLKSATSSIFHDDVLLNTRAGRLPQTQLPIGRHSPLRSLYGLGGGRIPGLDDSTRRGLLTRTFRNLFTSAPGATTGQYIPGVKTGAGRVLQATGGRFARFMTGSAVGTASNLTTATLSPLTSSFRFIGRSARAMVPQSLRSVYGAGVASATRSAVRAGSLARGDTLPMMGRVNAGFRALGSHLTGVNTRMGRFGRGLGRLATAPVRGVQSIATATRAGAANAVAAGGPGRGKALLGGLKGGTKAIGSMLGGGIGSITGIIGSVGSLMGPLLVILPLIIGIVVAVKMLMQNWGKVSRAMKPGLDAIKNAWGELMKAFKSVGKIFGDAFKDVDSASNKGGKAVSIWQTVGEGFGNVMKLVGGVIKLVAFGIKMLAPIFRWFAGIVSSQMNVVINIVKAIMALFKGDFGKFFEYLKRAAIYLLKYFFNIAKPFTGLISFLAKTILSFVGKILGALSRIPGIGRLFKGVSKTVNDLAKNFNLNKTIDQMFDKMLAGPRGEIPVTVATTERTRKSKSTVGNEPEKDNLPTSPDGGGGSGKSRASEMWDNLLSALKDKLEEYIGKIKDTINKAFEATWEARLKIFDDQIKAIDELEKKEEELLATQEYVQSRRDALNKRTLDRQNYVRNRALAIYEGRIDDARMLDLEFSETDRNNNKAISDLDTQRARTLLKAERDLQRQRISIARDAAEQRKKIEEETLKEQLDLITKYTPKTGAEWTAMMDNINNILTQYGIPKIEGAWNDATAIFTYGVAQVESDMLQSSFWQGEWIDSSIANWYQKITGWDIAAIMRQKIAEANAAAEGGGGGGGGGGAGDGTDTETEDGMPEGYGKELADEAAKQDAKAAREAKFKDNIDNVMENLRSKLKRFRGAKTTEQRREIFALFNQEEIAYLADKEELVPMYKQLAKVIPNISTEQAGLSAGLEATVAARKAELSRVKGNRKRLAAVLETPFGKEEEAFSASFKAFKQSEKKAGRKATVQSFIKMMRDKKAGKIEMNDDEKKTVDNFIEFITASEPKGKGVFAEKPPATKLTAAQKTVLANMRSIGKARGIGPKKLNRMIKQVEREFKNFGRTLTAEERKLAGLSEIDPAIMLAGTEKGEYATATSPESVTEARTQARRTRRNTRRRRRLGAAQRRFDKAARALEQARAGTAEGQVVPDEWILLDELQKARAALDARRGFRPVGPVGPQFPPTPPPRPRRRRPARPLYPENPKPIKFPPADTRALDKSLDSPETRRRASDAGRRHGTNFSSGVKTGIQNSTNTVRQPLLNLVDFMDTTTGTSMQSRSPSKRAAKFGKYWAKGIAQGLLEPESVEALSKAINALINPFLNLTRRGYLKINFDIDTGGIESGIKRRLDQILAGGFVFNRGGFKDLTDYLRSIAKFIQGILDGLDRQAGFRGDFTKGPIAKAYGTAMASIPLATGGIVKRRAGGILAQIGEGRYDEAVIPLPNGLRNFANSFQPASVSMATFEGSLQSAMSQALREHMQYMNGGNSDGVTIYVDNFIGQPQWFESMMTEYGVKVAPNKQRSYGTINRKITSYQDNSYRTGRI